MFSFLLKRAAPPPKPPQSSEAKQLQYEEGVQSTLTQIIKSNPEPAEVIKAAVFRPDIPFSFKVPIAQGIVTHWNDRDALDGGRPLTQEEIISSLKQRCWRVEINSLIDQVENFKRQMVLQSGLSEAEQQEHINTLISSIAIPMVNGLGNVYRQEISSDGRGLYVIGEKSKRGIEKWSRNPCGVVSVPAKFFNEAAESDKREILDIYNNHEVPIPADLIMPTGGKRRKTHKKKRRARKTKRRVLKN
jgi:hypothetical protein